MYLCITIGTNSIKALEKSLDGKILKWGRLERTSKPFHTSIAPMDENDAVAHLKMLLNKMGSESREAAVAIPAFLTFTAVAESADAAQIPAAVGTFNLDVIDLGQGLPGQGKVFLTAVPKDIIEKYGRILGEAGFESARWESESVILARNFGDSPEPVLLVALDQRSTTFVVARNAQPIFVEQTDFTLASDNPDVILNKVKNIVTEKKIKNIRWITEKNFLNF